MASSVLEGSGEHAVSATRDADVLASSFYPLSQRLFDEDDEFVVTTQQKLTEARMPETVEIYLARALGLGTIAGLALWLLGIVVGYSLFATGLVQVGTLLGIPIANETVLAVVEALRVPVLIFTTGLVFGTAGFGLGFGTLLAVPYMRASARQREINLLLADAVAFMYALSVGGLNQLEIIEAMARADDTYGEVAREFQSILQETEYFDDDYRTAIRKQVDATPSDDLAEFLTDMLAIVDSGGNMEQFLEDKKHKHMRTAKQQQERILDTLELFAEMYITLSLFPLLLIIVLVVMSMLGETPTVMLYLTVYGLIPLLGAGFLVLVATVKQDEPGDGVLDPDPDSEWVAHGEHSRRGLFHLGLIEAFTGEYEIFEKIRSGEGTYETIQLLKRPHVFFREHPLYTLVITVPTAMTILVIAFLSGSAPTSYADLLARPIWGTFVLVYLPLYVCTIPLAIFWEWNRYSRRAILGNLSDTLRKLAGVNETGMTLLESVETVAKNSSGKLAAEFRTIGTKVDYGVSITDAFIDFNNDYRVPRLARTIRLITKAQEASNEIRAVLTTAAKASENQDDIERERKSRTRMQVAIILLTFVTLLGVIAILETQFISSMSGLAAQAQAAEESGATASFGSGVNTTLVSLLFFHAVTLQAIISGVIGGYIRDAKVLSGTKYVVALATIALAVWMVIG
jgi:flagellar protein FlaJ